MTDTSNITRLSDADACSTVRSAGTKGMSAQNALAQAAFHVFDHAYEGNLNPAIVAASYWEEGDRKRLAAVMSRVTGGDGAKVKGDLRITGASDKHKGASLTKGWQGRKLETWDREALEGLVTASCSTNKAGVPVENRASLWRMAKSLQAPKEKIEPTMEILETKTVSAILALGLPGVPEESVKDLISDVFSKIGSVSRQAVDAAKMADEAARVAKEATEAAAMKKAKAAKARKAKADKLKQAA